MFGKLSVDKKERLQYNVITISLCGGNVMSKLLQVRLDENLKNAADNVFSGLGLDTSTAVRMFLTVAVETRSLPFEVKSRASKESKTEWSAEYIKKVMQFGETPDPTFLEQPELPFTDRGEMFG